MRVLSRIRAFRLARVLQTGGKGGHHESLRTLETVEAIAGVGQPNVIEVRCADSVINVRVNGAHLGSFVDARYLHGEHGLSVGATDTGGQALITAFEAREIG